MVEAMGCTRKTGPEMAVRFRLTHLVLVNHYQNCNSLNGAEIYLEVNTRTSCSSIVGM